MVQQDTTNSLDESSSAVMTIPDNPAKGIPEGKYRLVGWGIDTTGRRLIDEIIQIAAYTPDSKFSQYIMPFADINPIYIHRHGIKVINTIRYRRLRDLNANQFVKTKSEISALQDFLQWLETVKTDDVDGLILIYYEVRKASPSMLLESLRRHQLIDRFSMVVKGFCNGFNIVQAKCANTTKSFNLRVMSKVLLNKEDGSFNNAVDRAVASFDIASHLAQSEREELEKPASGMTGFERHLIQFICPYSNAIDDEEEEIRSFKVLLERQNTFRPVFGALLRASSSERQHASHLRRLLAENDINYDKLKIAYDESAKEGLEKIIKAGVPNGEEKDIEELLNILDCFFDPSKKAVQPKAGISARFYRPMGGRNNNRKRRSFNRNKNGGSESRSSPNSKEANATERSSDESSPRADHEAGGGDGGKKTEVIRAGTPESPVKTAKPPQAQPQEVAAK
ncbi:unnamed protein product [Acanthoscelides obtectus]|uniref:Maternal protein exuperantia n=1 Tax=Acanthoscelides obtectus TaxID=200917 RepID=A0A9P0KTI6_ACAOB|nr:unnamed protein product [Acanthoscelides obtectus]CAK1675124.1 Maternal protein exuperantia [Acanthoscelides obtectus]